MDYSKLSDFEINLQVNRALGMKHYPNKEKQIVEVFGDVVIFDPCNNPADAWPIIVENNISLILDNPSSKMATSNCVGWYSDEEPPIHASNQNPLRAAMTVFLMMQGSANVQDNPA